MRAPKAGCELSPACSNKTRDALQIWQDVVRNAMREICFTASVFAISVPSRGTELCGEINEEDFLCAGDTADSEWACISLKDNCELVRIMLGANFQHEAIYSGRWWASSSRVTPSTWVDTLLKEWRIEQTSKVETSITKE